MEDADVALRNATYRLFVHMGRAPDPAEVGDDAGRTPDEVVAGWRRLHDAHALVLASDGRSLRMANPFSGVPTPHRVHANDRWWWYANCAWDAFGILAALGVDGQVASSCPDCGEPIEITVRAGEPVDDEHVVHINVPASHWWDDIVFT